MEQKGSIEVKVQNKSSSGSLKLAAIFSIFFLMPGVVVVNPAMAKFAATFPEYNFALIATMPTLTILVSTLWAGSVAGKSLKYRTLAVMGCVLFIVGGTAPAFLNNFIAIIACRAVFGIGVGLLTPLSNGLIIGLYEGQKQAAYLGYGTLFINGGAVLLQMFGGALAEIDWHFVFYAHLLGIISLVLVFFLPEPQNLEGPQARNTKGKMEKVAFGVYALGILFFVYSLLSFPIMVNMALLFQVKAAGGAAIAATALSLFTVGGALGGLAFGFVFKRFKRFCLTIGYALCGLGVLVILIGTNAITMTVGAFLQGFAYSLVMPALISLVGTITPPSTVAMGISIMMAMMNIAAFISTFYLKILTNIFGENIYSSLKVFIAVVLTLAAVFIFINPFAEKHQGLEGENA